jgi:hypothetical protein
MISPDLGVELATEGSILCTKHVGLDEEDAARTGRPSPAANPRTPRPASSWRTLPPSMTKRPSDQVETRTVEPVIVHLCVEPPTRGSIAWSSEYGDRSTTPIASLTGGSLLLTLFFCGSLLSAGASPAAPLGGIWQCEQVQTGEHQQDEREQCQKANPDGLFLLDQRDDVEDDSHRKGMASQR